MLSRLSLVPIVWVAWSLTAAAGHAADRLILRNLEILANRTVVSFDEDGVIVEPPRDGGRIVAWDEIERGRVALDQPRFDALLAELGAPLYRIRQRLKIGDYRAVGEIAEALYPRFAGRKSQTAYLVAQATMWSRLAGGQREAAVEPFLRCYGLLRSRAAESALLPGARRLKVDAATAISQELVPIWLNRQAAKDVLPVVQETIRSLPQPRPSGAYVYYASLAIAAGQPEEAERVLPLVGEVSDALSWRDILEAQRELAFVAPGDNFERLKAGLQPMTGEARIAALYVVGQALLRSPEEDRQREGILTLLTLPAAYGHEQPELAAAALYDAAQSLVKLKDTTGAAAVWRELAHHYAGTRYGAILREEKP